MKRPLERTRWRSARVWALPPALLLALALPSLRGGDWRVDTGRYAAIGLSAWRDGELWTLHAGDALYCNKPPLALWIHGLFLHIFGPELWAARLPAVLAAAACAAFAALLAKELCGRKVGLLTGLVLASTLEVFRHTRQVSLDAWLMLFMTLALLCVVTGVKRAQAWRIGASGVFIGLALMVKPVMALGAPVIVALWMALAKPWRGSTARAGASLLAPLSEAERDPPRPLTPARAFGALAVSVLIALLVAAPWHVSMAIQHGRAFIHQYFGAQVLDRAVGDTFQREAWWWYLQSMLRTYWPWFITLGLALWTWARRRELARDPRAALLAAVWALAWLVALSVFADKRARYMLHVYPALAWLSAMWLARWSPAWLRRGRGRTLLDPLILSGCAIGAALVFTPLCAHDPPDAEWAALNAFLAREPEWEIVNGSMDLGGAARIYLAQGRWPTMTAGPARETEIGAPTGAPPAAPSGALVIYDERREPRPPPAAEVAFRAGRLVVVTAP